MAIPLGLNDLSKIDLIACDMAYGADRPERIQIRTALASYPDTTFGTESPYGILSGYEVRKISK